MFKTVLRAMLTLCLLFGTAAAQAAEPYPTRPVKIIANMAAGGGTDTIARILAPKMSDRLGRPVVVENRAGAAGQLGTELAATSAPDGYTMLVASSTAVTLPYLRKTRYELLRDFVPVGQIGLGGFVLVINKNLPFTTAREFLADAKAHPRKYTFGSPGHGSAGHLALSLLKSRTGIEMVHVPFKSSTEVAQAIIGGQIDCAIDIVPIQKAHIDAQSVRALVTTGSQREPTLANLPTIDELGLVPGGYVVTFWYGAFLPRGTPTSVVERVQRDFAAVMKDPDMIERLKGFSVAPSQVSGADFERSISAEIAMWRKVIDDNKLSIDE